MHIRLFHLAFLGLLPAMLWSQTEGAINQTDAQGRKQGPWVKKWLDSEQVRYSGQFKDDKPVGSFVYYSTTGKMESRIDHYPDGKAAHGKHFHPDGTLMAQGRYVGQDKDSTWNYYDTQGNIRSTEQWKNGKLNGTMTSYYKNGKPAEVRTFKNGEMEGPVEQYFENGQLRYRSVYSQGAPEGKETFYFQDGTKEIEGQYVNGLREGGWKYYNDNGSVQVQVLYARGNVVRQKFENGTFTDYWEDGQPKSEYTYKNGLREGPFTEWYNNGTWTEEPLKLGPPGMEYSEVQRKITGQTKKREGRYKNDLLDGPVKEYDERGRLVSNVSYVGGEPAQGDTKP